MDERQRAPDLAVLQRAQPARACRRRGLDPGPDRLDDENVGGRATGRSLRYAPIPIEAFEAGLKAEDAPPDLIALLRYLFTEVLDGRNEQLTDGVQRALGREPRDFTAFARRAAAEGAWSRSIVA